MDQILVHAIRIIRQITIQNTPYNLDNDYHCLASNIYWESRNQSLGGKIAVGQVVLNRVDNEEYPSTIFSYPRSILH